ncbi:Wings apart-like protein regulation of heterochromatin [Nesidiocoris tenuis]|uniref:Wings apart-like protein regulation of heterochromatin n=1 Tax=Nesidiocoris tenuis TaxID=355587 RepID=A0ABN7AIG9_9HEMI|nr:Wings apart-like protein regulation of heterochromatin [Nesidiocoris tenuis]
MSRGCYKTYGRKLNGPGAHPSIQFDKLFCENSNKPTASKSTGTVGKWGITSFTSIRSSKFTVGLGSCKRQRDKKESYKAAPAAAITPPPESPAAPKPKKFFKSRITINDVPAKPSKSFHAPTRSPRTPQSPPSPPPPRSFTKQEVKPVSNRPVRQASLAAAKKLVDIPDNEFEEEYDEDLYAAQLANATRETVLMHPMTAHPPTPPEIESNLEFDEPKEENADAPSSPPHPPIVLRISKGHAQLVGADDEVVHEEKEKHSKKDRRRSHGSDSGDGVSPKRHKSKHRNPPPLSPPPQTLAPEHEEVVEQEKMEVEEANTQGNTDAPSHTDIDKPEAVSETVMSSVITNSTGLKMSIRQSTVTEDDRMKLLRDLEDEENLQDEVVKEEESDHEQQVEQKDDPVPEVDLPKDLSVSAPPENTDWVSADYVPPPEIKEEEMAAGAKIEPIVLRRPSTGSGAPRPPKKGSIFKSRGPEKRKVRYIHNWSDQKDDAAQKSNKPASTSKGSAFDETEFDDESLTRVTLRDGQKQTVEDSQVTSITCSKKTKEFYTVVRNVKKVHQLQESGEFQEFNDDVEYILDALKDNNPISTRCLSAITLASKCMSPEFRMHVRAHGTVTKFFKALHDATKDQRLGMCTATVMFVLSQDRLNMDIDRESLELMLNLLESDASHSSALEGCGLSDAELAKTKDRVRSLCQEIQEQGHAKHLNLDNITVGQLAMETLLSLTCKRAGEWFKEELRDLGGLEHIIKTIGETCRPINSSVGEWTPQLLDRLKKADRCLKVLENVTLQNEENNNYLLTYGDGILVDTVVRVFQVCDQQLVYYPTLNSKDKDSTGAVIRECLIANLKVLINLTHDYGNKSFGSTLAGKKDGVIEASLHILMEIPKYVPEEQKFDVTVLALILLINLVEHSESNRKLLISSNAPYRCDAKYDDATAVSALVGMFLQQEELARTEERKTDAILDGKEKPPSAPEQKKTNEEHMEETVQLLLQKAGRHMEHTLIGAYIALLLGYLIIDNEEYELFVREHMPNKNYRMLLSVLQKFYNFMTLTAAAGAGSSRGIKATERLIKQLTEIDQAICGEAPPPAVQNS